MVAGAGQTKEAIRQYVSERNIEIELANAVALMEEIKSGKRKLDLLEVMACLNGCVKGGGQPVPVDEGVIRARAKAIYDLDNGSSMHAAHGNPSLQEIYRECLGEPGGKLSRELLYTTFAKRKGLL